MHAPCSLRVSYVFIASVPAHRRGMSWQFLDFLNLARWRTNEVGERGAKRWAEDPASRWALRRRRGRYLVLTKCPDGQMDGVMLRTIRSRSRTRRATADEIRFEFVLGTSKQHCQWLPLFSRCTGGQLKTEREGLRESLGQKGTIQAPRLGSSSRDVVPSSTTNHNASQLQDSRRILSGWQTTV